MTSLPTPTQIFVEQLTCPVCYEIFDGRIVQCKMGHSVCESCHSQDPRDGCSQCRGPFNGTRNFLLEEMIKQLRQMKYALPESGTPVGKPVKNNDGAATKNVADSAEGSDGSTSDSTSNEGLSAAAEAMKKQLAEQLSEHLTRLFDVVSKPKPRVMPAPRPRIPAQGSMILHPFIIIPRIDEEPIINAPVHPLQQRGVFKCRMLECSVKLPICRIVNHIRTEHPAGLLELQLQNRTDTEFVTHIDFECVVFRQAIRISAWGVFFFIFDVERKNNKTLIASWVQFVGRQNDHYWFKFQLKMKIVNNIVSYTDIVYSDTSDAAYIVTKKQCLMFETELDSIDIGGISADIRITKTAAHDRSSRRRANTIIAPIPAEPVEPAEPNVQD